MSKHILLLKIGREIRKLHLFEVSRTCKSRVESRKMLIFHKHLSWIGVFFCMKHLSVLSGTSMDSSRKLCNKTSTFKGWLETWLVVPNGLISGTWWQIWRPCRFKLMIWGLLSSISWKNQLRAFGMKMTKIFEFSTQK